MLNGKILKISFASPIHAQNGKLVIGKDNGMPWQGMLPSDMKRFAELTTYHSVICGRRTWDSLDQKFRPLSNRQNIVLTRSRQFTVEPIPTTPNTGVNVAHSLEEAVAFAKSENIWVIGGAEIYALALPYTDFIHWTAIDKEFLGDTVFPYWDRKEWKTVSLKHFRAGVDGTEKKKDALDSSYYVFKRV
jgi:dihydrofolate reductase